MSQRQRLLGVFCLLFCLFLATRGSCFPDQESNLCLLQWNHGVLTTGLPEKSLSGRDLNKERAIEVKLICCSVDVTINVQVIYRKKTLCTLRQADKQSKQIILLSSSSPNPQNLGSIPLKCLTDQKNQFHSWLL